MGRSQGQILRLILCAGLISDDVIRGEKREKMKGCEMKKERSIGKS
jgi:hypothetical protein